MPCEIRPIAVESPQTAKGGRGLATNSGEKPKDEDKNVPYKKRKKQTQTRKGKNERRIYWL